VKEAEKDNTITKGGMSYGPRSTKKRIEEFDEKEPDTQKTVGFS
jgi:hypothetical protein